MPIVDSEPRDTNAAATAPGEPQLLRESSVDYRDPAKGQAVRAMFAGIAGRYDLLNHLLSFNRDKAWRRAAVKFAALASGASVLDVCCGTGDLAFEFARRVDGARVTGADFTPEMVRIANGKCRARQERGHASIPRGWLVADTLRLPFPDAHFDCCSVGFGIRNVQDVAGGIREMARVVRPGGAVAILEFTQPRRKVFQRMYRWYSTRVLPRVGQMLSRSKEKAYSYLPDSIALFPGPDELAQLMEREGLRDVRYKLLTFGVVAVHAGIKNGSGA